MIYVLGDPDAARRSSRVSIEPLPGGRAFLEIVRATFNLIAIDRDRLAGQYAFARQLAGDVPVRRLLYPRKLSALPEVCDAVLSDLARSRPAALQSGGSVRTLAAQREPT